MSTGACGGCRGRGDGLCLLRSVSLNSGRRCTLASEALPGRSSAALGALPLGQALCRLSPDSVPPMCVGWRGVTVLGPGQGAVGLGQGPATEA